MTENNKNTSSEFWDDYGKERSPWRNRTLYLHHELEEKKIISLLRGLPRSARVLDVGCGDGCFLDLLSRTGFKDIRGIDAGASMVERCLDRNISARHMALEDIPGEEEYDLILLIEVLEHLDNPRRSIRKVKELLSEGGNLLLAVPVCDSLLKRYHRLRYGVGKFVQVRDWDDTHLHAFSMREIRELLSGLSFRIAKSVHVSNPFPWAARYGGVEIGEFFQRFSLGGRFGDILIVLAEKMERLSP